MKFIAKYNQGKMAWVDANSFEEAVKLANGSPA